MLMRQRGWTESEVETLKRLYPTSASISDLLEELPSRSPNSVRLMASRLGLKRPTLLAGITKVSETKTSSSIGGGVLVRCSQCGGWIGVSAGKAPGSVVFCDHCGGVNLLAD
jgi:hypothetical protein